MASRRSLIIFSVLIIVGIGAVGLATADQTVSVHDPPDGPTIAAVDPVFDDPVPVTEDEIRISGHTISGSTDTVAEIGQWQDDEIRIEDFEGGELTIDSPDRPTTTISGEADVVEYDDYAVEDDTSDLFVDGVAGTLDVTMTGLDVDAAGLMDDEGEIVDEGPVEDGEITFSVDEAGEYQLVAVTILEPEIVEIDDPATVDEPFSVAVEVENLGTTSEEELLTVDINGQTQSETVEIDAGETISETFEFSVGEHGEYTATAEIDGVSDEQEFTVLHADAYFGVEFVDSDSPVPPGEVWSPEIEVTNWGHEPGSQDISAVIDGIDATGETPVSLDGGASDIVTIDVPLPEEIVDGEYDAEVYSKDDSDETTIDLVSDDSFFRVVDIDADEVVDLGDELEVAADIENIGVSDEQEIVFELRDETASTTISLDQDQQATTETVTLPAEGDTGWERVQVSTDNETAHSDQIRLRDGDFGDDRGLGEEIDDGNIIGFITAPFDAAIGMSAALFLILSGLGSALYIRTGSLAVPSVMVFLSGGAWIALLPGPGVAGATLVVFVSLATVATYAFWRASR